MPGLGPVLLKDIARRQHLSERYLENLIILLKTAGLVTSARGARGGFALARPPAEIRLSEIIQTVEGSIAPVECVDSPEACSRSDLCVTRDVWTGIKRATGGILESTTLEDLSQQQREKGEPGTITYHI